MKRYGLIGNPVDHSRSPAIFRKWFENAGLADYSYDLYPLENSSGLEPLLRKSPDIAGLNVTFPFKQDVIPLLSGMDAAALACGSVNTICVRRNGAEMKLYGFNTDGAGFILAYGSLFSPGSRVLLLGTGGAARAVSFALRAAGHAVQAVSRKETESAISYERINIELLTGINTIIQATPLGMHGQQDRMPEFPVELLNEGHTVIDLVYSPEETLFMREAARRGARVRNGLDMLYGQAELSFAIWKDPETYISTCQPFKGPAS